MRARGRVMWMILVKVFDLVIAKELEEKIKKTEELVQKWDWDSALPLLKGLEAELASRDLEESSLGFRVHLMYCLLYNQMQNTSLIEHHARKAVALLSHVPPDTRDVASIQAYLSLGGAMLYKRDFYCALELFEKALVVARRLNDPKYVVLTLYNVGLCHFSLGNFSQAKDFFNSILELEQGQEGPFYGLWSMGFLQLIHTFESNEVLAREMREQLLRLIHQLPKDRKHAVLKISALEIILDVVPLQDTIDEYCIEAGNLLEETLREFPEVLSTLGFSLIFYYAKKSEFDKAWSVLNQLLEKKVTTNPAELKTDGIFVKAYLTARDWKREPDKIKRLHEARKLFKEALMNARKHLFLEFEIKILLELISVDIELGEIEQAIANIIRLSWSCRSRRLHLPWCLMKALQIRLYCLQDDLTSARDCLSQLQQYVDAHDLIEPIILQILEREKEFVESHELLAFQAQHLQEVSPLEDPSSNQLAIEEVLSYIHQARQFMMTIQ